MATKVSRPSFSSSSGALLAVPYSVTPGESRNFDLITSSQNVSTGSTSDPAYLFSQLKSVEWIRRYGLKSEKLTFDQILQQIGFKRVESFDPVIGKTVSAKYAGNLYHEVQHDNGDRYVLTCRPEKLREYHHRLVRMLNLLRKRLAFISQGSRRLFGIIGEPSVCLICDCKTFDHRIFNQFQTALTSLFKEQISKIKRFNIIWISNDNEQFREQPIDVSATTIDQAIDWICERKCPRNKISISSTCEAVLKAYKNKAHSIYLLTEGDSSDLAREMLRDNIVKTRLTLSESMPLHVVSLFCHNNDTSEFLRSIAQTADGSYFCYKIKNEISDLKAPSNLHDPTRIKLQDDKLLVGTNALTPIPEYPNDIALMYKEILQCQNVIDRIEKILGFIRDENRSPLQTYDDTTKSGEAFNTSGENNFQRSMIIQSSALFNGEENDMTSADWLKIYGIDAQKLDFFSVLQSAAFRHCDGVVTVLKPPDNSNDVTDETPANPQEKLINAKYCDQFAHVPWPDGTIRHVHVTPELHRDYERRIRALLEKIRARLSYLKKGSRDVFGTVLESNIYVLIDTSKSMEHHLGFVKEKLRLLIQDQLFAKERVNMVAYNSTINPWRDRLTKINDSTISSQLQPWIDGLNAEGSTNTLAALRFALADPGTEAIYLLSDGRPDQNERHILSQVQYRQIVPIHTIAFNCQDQSANQFLYDLAKQTGGRFHAFKYGFEKETAVEIPESEDVGYLKRELNRGENELERIASLRDECLGHAWTRENLQSKSTKYKIRSTTNNNSTGIPLKSHSTLDIAFRPTSSSMSQRINKKKRSTTSLKPKRRSQSVTNFTEQGNVINLEPNQWLLPETQDYLKGHNSKSDTENEYSIEPKSTITKKSRTSYDEVKSYLKKNSLLVRGLTIFDVLHPTTLNIRDPRHIQVIDRYILAKVWDDILPLAYGSFVGKLRLVNHYAVDLEKYEANLRELIANYHQFTSQFIWKYLNDDNKRKLGPYLHWKRLSKDEQNIIIQEITKEEYTSQSALENFAWGKLNDQEQKDLLEEPAAYQDNNQTLLKNALNDSELEYELKGVARMDLEIDRAIKFLKISTDLRQLQKRADVDSKSTIEPKTKPKRKPSGERSFGQRVLCRFDNDGFFYSGTIQKTPNGQSIVHFDMGIEQEAVGHILLPTNGAIAQPNLFVNDRVLVRQMNKYREFWAPGIVIILPSAVARSPPLYTVQYYTPCPHQVDVVRRDLLKISLSLFERTLLFIQNLNHQTIPTVNDDNKRRTPSFEKTLREELKPLTAKVEHLHKSHNRRYNKLKEALNDQMIAINNLQQKRPKSIQEDRSNQTVEISVKSVISPKPSSRTSTSRTTTSSTTEKEDSLLTGTEVYTVWFDDDVLCYEGIIIEKEKNSNDYKIRRIDLPNNISTISRDDIYLQNECQPLKTFESKTFALIEYPNDSRQCWSPAAILGHISERRQVHVRFYDGIDQYLSYKTNGIQISEEKFREYASKRIEFEKNLHNQAIVGLNNDTETYMLGTIIDRIESGHKYTIRWCDDSENSQTEEHLFGTLIRRNRCQRKDRVLALDEDQFIYKPGIILDQSDDEKTLTVRFIDPKEKNKVHDVAKDATFVITERYYEFIQKKMRQ